MERKDLQSLMETYLKMNESVELLNEIDADEMGTPSLASRNAASQRENEAKLKRLRAQRALSGRPPVANLPSNLKSTEQGATAAGMRVAGKMADIRGSQTPGSQTPKTTSTTSSTPRPAAKPQLTAQQKKDNATNAKYQELRKTDPAKAKEFGMKANQAKYGKDFAKPKTPNPLMKDMPGRNKAELERVRGNAAINSIAKSPNAKKILNTSKIGQASLNRSEFGSATKPKPIAPNPASVSGTFKPVPGAPTKSAANTKFKPLKEDVMDIFDIIKSHLLDEGYAETEENALVIMTNMSEEWKDDIVERYKGKHGQSSDEYKRDRSPGGKMVSGDDKQSGAEYTHGRRVKAENPGSQPDEGGKTKPKSQGKMDKGTRADLEYRKANLKKEEAEYVDEGIIDAAKAGSKRHQDAMKGAGRAIKKAGIRARKLGKALEPAADTAKSAASGVGKAVKGTYEAGKKTGEFVKKGAQRHNDMVKAAKKVFNKEELELIAQIMIDEGYNLSDYTWEEFHTLCLDAEMLDENRAAARSAGGYKDDSKKQPDPSKEGFTGVGKMSIKDIMALNKKIEARNKKK